MIFDNQALFRYFTPFFPHLHASEKEVIINKVGKLLYTKTVAA